MEPNDLISHEYTKIMWWADEAEITERLFEYYDPSVDNWDFVPVSHVPMVQSVLQLIHPDRLLRNGTRVFLKIRLDEWKALLSQDVTGGDDAHTE